MRAKVLAAALSAAVAGASGCGTDPSRVEHVDAAAVCAALVAEYAAAWPAALACDPGVLGQCAALRPKPMHDASGAVDGLGCDAAVAPAHVKGLDAILARFDAAGCKVMPLPCPLLPPLDELPRRCPASGGCE
jgi:hypothetical protein